MDPPLFFPSSLFRCSEDDDGEDASEGGPAPGGQSQQDSEEPTAFVERRHAFPGGMELLIQEFSFHQLNANLLWPGTFAFCEWLLQHQMFFEGQRILELGRYTWGDPFPVCNPDWDIIIASDILLYVKQYPNLIKTLCFLLGFYSPKDNTAGPGTSKLARNVTISGKNIHLRWPVLLMSWRRRIGKEDEALFFNGCADAGLLVEHLGSRVYCISLQKSSIKYHRT
ncbi:hypothetical protein Taro_037718 [Colocasia esculenta]|uniref:Uncharacterized protein n=1 Tax=Colocasia esculenta TaxID=4460 RepID=A0A843W1C6_COLES|nr:hypothetical protein [Colocasia esculenta]